VIVAGVLGSPISHSLSPLLHQTAYEFLGVQATYSSYEVQSGQLQNFLNGNGAHLNSLSLTMPLKEEALTIADSVTDIARQIQSGNTVQKINGKWCLTSTDVEGLTFALHSHNRNAEGNVLIIGAGATARAVVAACDGVSETVTIVSRNPEREKSIRSSGPNLAFDFIPWSSHIDFGSYDLVVNTTPSDVASVFLDQIDSASATLFEVLYNPWPTPLLSKWRKAGGYGIDGLDLLIHQAISQVEIFSSCSVNRSEMAQLLRTAGEKALS
jgi:shikimate dehydrogenase